MFGRNNKKKKGRNKTPLGEHHDNNNINNSDNSNIQDDASRTADTSTRHSPSSASINRRELYQTFIASGKSLEDINDYRKAYAAYGSGLTEVLSSSSNYDVKTFSISFTHRMCICLEKQAKLEQRMLTLEEISTCRMLLERAIDLENVTTQADIAGAMYLTRFLLASIKATVPSTESLQSIIKTNAQIQGIVNVISSNNISMRERQLIEQRLAESSQLLNAGLNLVCERSSTNEEAMMPRSSGGMNASLSHPPSSIFATETSYTEKQIEMGKSEEEELPEPIKLPLTSVVALRGKIVHDEGGTILAGSWAKDRKELLKEGGYTEQFKYENSSDKDLSGRYDGGFKYGGTDVVDNLVLSFEPNNRGGCNVTGSGVNVFGSFDIQGIEQGGVLDMCRKYTHAAIDTQQAPVGKTEEDMDCEDQASSSDDDDFMTDVSVKKKSTKRSISKKPPSKKKARKEKLCSSLEVITNPISAEDDIIKAAEHASLIEVCVAHIDSQEWVEAVVRNSECLQLDISEEEKVASLCRRAFANYQLRYFKESLQDYESAISIGLAEEKVQLQVTRLRAILATPVEGQRVDVEEMMGTIRKVLPNADSCDIGVDLDNGEKCTLSYPSQGMYLLSAAEAELEDIDKIQDTLALATELTKPNLDSAVYDRVAKIRLSSHTIDDPITICPVGQTPDIGVDIANLKHDLSNALKSRDSFDDASLLRIIRPLISGIAKFDTCAPPAPSSVPTPATVSQPRPKTKQKVKFSKSADSAELARVITVEELKADSPRLCSSKGCKLAACSDWKSGGQLFHPCLDHQLTDFGGWKKGKELPINHMTEEHHDLITTLCTEDTNPDMPYLPPVPPENIRKSILSTIRSSQGDNEAGNVLDVTSSSIVGVIEGKADKMSADQQFLVGHNQTNKPREDLDIRTCSRVTQRHYANQQRYETRLEHHVEGEKLVVYMKHYQTLAESYSLGELHTALAIRSDGSNRSDTPALVRASLGTANFFKMYWLDLFAIPYPKDKSLLDVISKEDADFMWKWQVEDILKPLLEDDNVVIALGSVATMGLFAKHVLGQGNEKRGLEMLQDLHKRNPHKFISAEDGVLRPNVHSAAIYEFFMMSQAERSDKFSTNTLKAITGNQNVAPCTFVSNIFTKDSPIFNFMAKLWKRKRILGGENSAKARGNAVISYLSLLEEELTPKQALHHIETGMRQEDLAHVIAHLKFEAMTKLSALPADEVDSEEVKEAAELLDMKVGDLLENIDACRKGRSNKKVDASSVDSDSVRHLKCIENAEKDPNVTEGQFVVSEKTTLLSRGCTHTKGITLCTICNTELSCYSSSKSYSKRSLTDHASSQSCKRARNNLSKDDILHLKCIENAEKHANVTEGQFVVSEKTTLSSGRGSIHTKGITLCTVCNTEFSCYHTDAFKKSILTNHASTENCKRARQLRQNNQSEGDILHLKCIENAEKHANVTEGQFVVSEKTTLLSRGCTHTKGITLCTICNLEFSCYDGSAFKKALLTNHASTKSCKRAREQS